MNFFINGNDYSSYVAKYATGYKKITGTNSYTTLDGTYYEDVIARKVELTVELIPIDSTTLAAFIDLCQEDTLNITYFDAKQNSNVTLEMIPTLSIPDIIVIKDSAIWGNVVLTLEAK